MSRVRTALRAGTAIILASGIAVLVAGGDLIDIARDVPQLDTLRTVQVPSGSSTQVCAGAPSLPDLVVDVDSEFAQVNEEAKTSLEAFSFPRGSLAPAPADLRGEEIRPFVGAGELLASVGENAETESVLTVKPAGVEAGLAAGMSLWTVGSGDLRSLSVSACQSAGSDLWLVGGSGLVGHSSVLTLTNPSLTPSAVFVSLSGPLGAVDAPLLETLVVAPESSLEVLLEAYAGDVAQLAAHVTSTGADVVATIAHTAIAGLDPLGFDIVTPSVAPTTQLLIPGVALTASITDEGLSSPSATIDGSAVRIVNPSEELATVSMVLLGGDGEIPIAGADNMTLSPGAVLEVSMVGLPEGDFAVRLDSDSAITASVVLQRGDEKQDHTWIPATTPTTLAVGAVSGMDRLLISSTEGAEVTVRRWDADGDPMEERVVHVAAGSTMEVKGAGVSAVELSSDTPVVAAAVYEALGGALFSVMPLTPDANERHTVNMRVVN